ncbi:mitogen-activated protein kinase kinase kinase 15 isoform X1 [Brienomyrus brachyistius]|uniref:mitogen-activated protein kinase kinase kinase 15 isoform X1 n=2 Tax=Brienomyrus brachyistius TaxID=42636 RepID=UPI0020B1B495|nr:mitogen-activated protein kinase kinase kinase 15 isoform X1 [Brienomyrus brachyistius]XP_048865949.1 mitogen-activated protein kinase kinase kinase 15 isoform X1 [Brienomyrus brachyistius]XP_048865950.1 mitogen-activated protein kinase kinase kinase 15 isoform X1 [Brienomyrus brachyistius]
MAASTERADVTSPSQLPKQRSLRAVYVLNDGLKAVAANSPESGALQCLQRACDAESAILTTVTFGRLDFGETTVLDTFYDADIAVVDMSDVFRQPSLFYHLGVRESFDMANNVILYHDTDPDTAQSLKDMVTQKNTASSGNYYFIPYVMTTNHEYMCCENDAQRRASEYMQPSWDSLLGPLCVPLVDRFTSLLKDIHVTSCASFKDTLLNDIRKARDKYQGEELAKELARIKLRIDNTEVLTQDIVMNLLFSYRDIQDYDAMVKLVQTLEMLPTCDLANQPMIQFHYAFALNRRNSPGDREQALRVMLQVLQSCDHPAPDMFCLCGRIYKDIFLDSDCKDTKNRDNAIQWYRKGFELQPTLYSGINLAVLLIVAGQQFENSIELRKIGVRLNSLLGRKGSLEKMNNYWDVGQFFTVSMLANDISKAVQAAEKLFKLKPPIWYLRSVVQNLQLIQRFKKQNLEHSPQRERLNFWMDIIVEATQGATNGLRFPVLILEPTKVYQPSYVSINSEAEEKNVSIWHVSPAETKGIHEWNFTGTSIKGISISKFDERCCFLYVHDNSDDFQIYFSTEDQCGRFCSMVKELISDGSGNAVELEGEGEGDTLEYEYDYNENGDRVVLGRGTYGVVYAGRDLSNQVRIAIKEIPERDSRYSQPLHEEIALHKYLKHRNIVQYLGSVSEDGYIKIFMEQVPGGSLSALLRSKWGPLKEATIVFYTRQILEGLRYLHENQIVHRDIKGDNVLVNTYSGVLKISDFGTSKRLAGVNPCTETFTGTLQYMAPEIIDKGPRGYGAPADIWSLGCTIIEMATGKPPFHELGEPQAAMFKVGMFKIHPEIPEALSTEAKSFILRCFEPDPNKRATAGDLLKDVFVRQNVKGKKSKIAFKPSDYLRSVSFPAQLQTEATGSSSSEHGSISPECDSKQDVFFEKKKRSASENLIKPPSSNYLSVPDEVSVTEDRSAPPSPEDRDSGLFLLKKDSERRAILYKVLNEDQEKVISNLMENHIQGSEELKLSVDHIKQIICILRDFIRSPERRVMATTISKLKLDLDFDSTSINQIQLVLFGFQDSVNKVLRNHHIKPHWMFAMDNIIRRAVQAAVTILIPELQTHFGPASESEGADKDADEVDVEEDADFGTAEPAAPEDPGLTSGVSTLSSVLSHESQRQNQPHPLGTQLGRMKQETNRLLEDLVQKEKEYQQVLRQSLQQRAHDLELMRVKSRPIDIHPPSIFHIPADAEPDKELTDWLKELGVDADTIEKFVMEDYTLNDILNDITKEDLRFLRLRGGVLCRIWRAIQRHRGREQRKQLRAGEVTDG